MKGSKIAHGYTYWTLRDRLNRLCPKSNAVVAVFWRVHWLRENDESRWAYGLTA